MFIEMEFDESNPELENARANALKQTEVVVRVLNVLKQLLNSSVFFAEVSRHAELLHSLT